MRENSATIAMGAWIVLVQALRYSQKDKSPEFYFHKIRGSLKAQQLDSASFIKRSQSN